MMKNLGKTVELREPIKLNHCNVSVDCGKEQSWQEGATKGSCEKDISAETEESKGYIDEVDERGDEDNVVGENCEKSSANENNGGCKEQ